MPHERSRLRLRLPNGAEMEAEGTPEFVAGERREFAALQASRAARTEPGEALEPAWEEIIEAKGSRIQLRAKLGGGAAETDACLVLVAASRAILRTPKPTAAQLTRWLRSSGYPVGRLDRILQAAVTKGEILASGSRRARRYELSGPGLAKAFRLGHQLRQLIQPVNGRARRH